MPQHFCVIPAAGRSSRMGRPKLSLPLGGRSVLERVVDSLRRAGCEVLVVLAPHTLELANAAQAAGALVLELTEPTAQMRQTVERGLEYLEERFRPAPEEPWLLVPADHPTLDAALVRQLLDEFVRRPDCSVAVPTYQGRRGHPALLRWCHAAGIRTFDAELGLNSYLRQFAAQTLEVPVETDTVLLDLDTPEDYARLCERYAAAE